MSASTGSFRLVDIRASSAASPARGGASEFLSVTDSITDLAAAGLLSLPTIEGEFYLPGLKTAARLVQALKRPARFVRTAAEELREERLNTLTHGLGLALSALGVVYLLTYVAVGGSWIRIASCSVYGASLVSMYAASTFFHAAQEWRVKRNFQVCDHVAIYLLIAGTYTPFLASLMRDYQGFALLACVWLLAAAGISIKVKCADRLEETSPLPCLALGWLGLAAVKPMLATIPLGCIALILAGGVSYSAGVIFYCRDDKRHFHAVWHLFVLAGTAIHFCAVLLYVAA